MVFESGGCNRFDRWSLYGCVLHKAVVTSTYLVDSEKSSHVVCLPVFCFPDLYQGCRCEQLLVMMRSRLLG